MRIAVFVLLILGNEKYVLRISGIRMANIRYHYVKYKACASRKSDITMTINGHVHGGISGSIHKQTLKTLPSCQAPLKACLFLLI